MGIGDVPANYGPPYSGRIFAPYTGNGPLGGLGGTLTGKPLARAQFLTWLKSFNPSIFERAVKYAEDWRESVDANSSTVGRIAGLGEGDTEPSSWWEKLGEGVTSLGTAYLAYKGQQNVLATNLQRAQIGLPPIDPSTGAPMIRTQVSLSPQILSRLTDSIGPMFLYGALAVGAVLLLSSFTRGRSRR